MQYRKLPACDISVSVLGLGTWAMGGRVESWGHVDDNESIGAIHAAMDAGVNFYDTAPIYGDGHAETILGRALRSRRDQAVIASKCGLLPPAQPDGKRRRCLRPDSIVAECEASLRRLGTDHIDLYQCHWPDDDTPERETFAALESLKAQGKIRAIGLSNYGCEQILRAREFARITSLQVPLSLLDRSSIDATVPFCAEHDLAVIAYSPLAKGLLTGKFTADSETTGIRRDDPLFAKDRFHENLRSVDRLRILAKSYGTTPGPLALYWVTQQPGVTAALMGAKRASQIVENLAAVELQLSAAQLDAVLGSTEDD